MQACRVKRLWQMPKRLNASLSPDWLMSKPNRSMSADAMLSSVFRAPASTSHSQMKSQCSIANFPLPRGLPYASGKGLPRSRCLFTTYATSSAVMPRSPPLCWEMVSAFSPCCVKVQIFE